MRNHFFYRPISSILLPTENPTLHCVQNSTLLEYFYIIAKMGRPVVGYLNKFIIKSKYCQDLI